MYKVRHMLKALLKLVVAIFTPAPYTERYRIDCEGNYYPHVQGWGIPSDTYRF